MDLVEVNPYLDSSRRTALLAARTILEVLSCVFNLPRPAPGPGGASVLSPKLFTLPEANQLLPSLEPLVRRLMAKRQELRQRHQVLQEFRARASGNGGVLPGSTFAQAKTESARLAAEIQEDVQRIESWGCVVKDLDHGLVDFPAQRQGEQVFLCWRLGEPGIRYWHGLQEGFAGRKPLGEDPAD